MISLCSIDIDYSAPDTEVTIIWGEPGTKQKEIRATVAPAPYQKDTRNVDVNTLPYYL
jgi:vanillate/3-O-methylgallate O-demethylase